MPGRWAIDTTVVPASSSVNRPISEFCLSSSSAEVASSMNTQSGLCSSSADEGEALLLATAEHPVPALLLVEPFDQLFETAALQAPALTTAGENLPAAAG